MDMQCNVELFGGIRVAQGKRVITRFRTQKTAALLGYLAFFGDRMHSRELLSDLLWPDASTSEARRLSLSVAISSLRSQLEPPEIPAHSLLLADRQSVGLTSLVVTDTARFEEAISDAEQARRRQERDDEVRFLQSAFLIYKEKLLPGYYETWIVPQQERLAEQYRLAVRRLASLYEEDGKFAAAIACTRRAAQSDPSDEYIAQDLIRLYLKNDGVVFDKSGSPISAPNASSSDIRKEYLRLKKELRYIGQAPSARTRALVAPLRKNFSTEVAELGSMSQSHSTQTEGDTAAANAALVVGQRSSVKALAKPDRTQAELSVAYKLISRNASQPVCYISLFGGMRVEIDRQVITQFARHKAASLLAYLAYFGDQLHSRDTLIDQFWPDAASVTNGRTSLRVTLSSLKKQLELPGCPPKSLIFADRRSIGLSSLIISDVALFQRYLGEAQKAQMTGDLLLERRLLTEATLLYNKELLPGYNDKWVILAREQTVQRFQSLQKRLEAISELGS